MKKIIVLLMTLVSVFMISCANDTPEPPAINITFKTFVDVVANKDWDNGVNFNVLNSSESEKFDKDIAAQNIWKRVEGAKSFSVVSSEHEGFLLVQGNDAKWTSIYKGIETGLVKGSDPWLKPLMIEDFTRVIDGKLWKSSGINFNSMNKSALDKLDADLLSVESSWKRNVGRELFSVVDEGNKDYILQQCADGSWISIYGGVETALTEDGQDPFVKPVEFENFLDIITAKSWPTKPNFNELTPSEMSVFASKCNASEAWKMAEGISEFAVTTKDGKITIHQNTDGTWWKEHEGRKAFLTEGEDYEVLPIAYADFKAVVEGKKWIKDIKFAAMDALENEEFMKAATAGGWTVSMKDETNGIDLFNAVWKADAKYRIYQDLDGSWWSGASSEVYGYIRLDLTTEGQEPVFDPEEKAYEEVFDFDLTGPNVILTKYKGGDKYNTVFIPGTFKGKNVTEIGANAFEDNTAITSITFSENLEKIGTDAFASVCNLKKLQFPNSLTNIGIRAFNSCSSVDEIVFGTGKLTIDEMAFGGCTSVSELEIPSDTKFVGKNVFLSWEDSQKLIVPADIDISALEHPSAFIGLDSKADIVWKDNEAVKDYVIRTGVNKFSIDGYKGTSESLVLDDTLKVLGCPVEMIGDGAFSNNTSITTLTICPNIKYVGSGAFAGWDNSRKLIIKEGVDISRWNTGWNAGMTAQLDLEGIKEGKWYFIPTADGLGLKLQKCYDKESTSLVIPGEYEGKKVLEICTNAFSECKATEFTVSEGTENLAERSFANRGTLKVKLPSTIRNIGDYAFENPNGNAEVNIPKGVTYVGYGAFKGWNKDSVIRIEGGSDKTRWSNSWAENCNAAIFDNSDGESSFKWSPLANHTVCITAVYVAEGSKNIIIPSAISGHTVSAVYGEDFIANPGIETVTIPKTVTYINNNPWRGWTGLTEFIVEEGSTSFRVESGCLIDNDTNTVVAGTKNCTAIPRSVRSIEPLAFDGLMNSELFIPKEVEVIPADISEDVSVTKIEKGSNALTDEFKKNWKTAKGRIYPNWSGDGQLVGWWDTVGGIEITGCIPDKDGIVRIEPSYDGKTVVGIYERTGYKDNTIQQVILSPGIKYIGDEAFYGAGNIEKVVLPNTLETVGWGTFALVHDNCQFYMEDGISEEINYTDQGLMRKHYHYGCDYLGYVNTDGNAVLTGYIGTDTDLVLPSSIWGATVTEIARYFALARDNFNSIKIPNSVTKVSFGAFKDCTTITSFEVDKTAAECLVWGDKWNAGKPVRYKDSPIT